MSTKEYAVKLLDTLTESQLLDLLKTYTDEDTFTRIEGDIIAHDPNRKHYNNFDELLKELDDENE